MGAAREWKNSQAAKSARLLRKMPRLAGRVGIWLLLPLGLVILIPWGSRRIQKAVNWPPILDPVCINQTVDAGLPFMPFRNIKQLARALPCRQEGHLSAGNTTQKSQHPRKLSQEKGSSPVEEVPVLRGRLEGQQSWPSALCHLVLSLCYCSTISTAAFKKLILL